MAALSGISRRLRHFLGSYLRAQDGAIAAIFALAVAVLLGMAALSIDLGKAWNLDTELQSAADAAALACASQLDRQPAARARATLAATGGLVQNAQTFASDGGGSNVTIQAGDIKFFSNITTMTEATSDADARGCQVTASPRTVSFSFAQLVGGPVSASPSAMAVAAMDTAKCKIPPMMICNPNEPGPFDAPGHIGDGIMLKESTGGGLAPGNFGLLALEGKILSADQIRDAWARTNPLAQCFGADVTTKPGQTTAISQGLNMRFDIYFTGKHQVPAGEPAVENNPFYVPSMNNVKGLNRAGAECSYQHPKGWNKPTQAYTGTNPPMPGAMGFPRDDCFYGAGWCDPGNGGTHFGDGAWDYETYRDTNHPAVTDPLNTWDLNGDGYPTRFETYQWELANQLALAEPEVGGVCHSAPFQTIPDRRDITIAVVDCSAVKGTMTVTPVAWVRLFLTEPMGVYDGNNDLYGEVIGPGAPMGTGVIKVILQLVK